MPDQHDAIVAQPGLSPTFLRVVGAVVAFAAAIAWAVAVVVGIIYSFKGGTDPKFLTSDAMKFLMPGLTALVGGVVAASFGLSGGSTRDENVNALGNVLAGEAPKPAKAGLRILVAEGYVVVYLIVGAAAGIAWIAAGGDTLDYVRILASAWIGMFLGIAQGFFNR